MKITKNSLDETIDLLLDSNSIAGASMLALKTSNDFGLTEITVFYTEEELLITLQATKQAYDILSELRDSL